MQRFSRKAVPLVLCVGFVAFTWAPLAVFGVLGRSPDTSRENRTPTPFPRLAFSATGLKEFARDFEGYLQDSMPLRGEFVGLLQSVKTSAAGVSPHPKVLIGTDGHLFYTESPVGRDHAMLQPLSDAELAQWRNLLQARHDDLARQGIRYLFVPAPDKQTIYPDYLPAELQARMPTRSRLDQLFDELRTNSTVAFLDLRPILRDGRSREDTYYRADTHWNAFGSYLGYREILGALKQWQPDLEPLAREELVLDAKTGPGQLAVMIGRIDSERFPDEYRPKAPRTHLDLSAESPLKKANDHPEFPLVTFQADIPNSPRLLVMTDSFGENLQHLLAHHFRRVDFVRTYRLNRQIVLAERPDIVVQIMVERSLYNTPPIDPVIR